jgi:hypothetical protein
MSRVVRYSSLTWNRCSIALRFLELCGSGYAHFGGGFDKAAVLGDEGKPGQGRKQGRGQDVIDCKV